MLAYYLDKIRATAQTQIQGRQYKTAPGIYNGFLGEGSELQTEVYLGIWNPRLFHLGDQLFYIPLFKYLIDEGYSVNIVGDSGLAPLFEELGCRCISIETFRNLDTRGAIVLSKADLITETQKLANNSFFIGFDYGRMEGAAPVAELILENTRSLLGAYRQTLFSDSTQAYYDSKTYTKILNNCIPSFDTEALSKLSGPAWVINPFVGSNFFDSRKRRGIFDTLSEEKIVEGKQLILSGSEGDAWDAQDISIDIDLRGKTNPMQLFSLLSHPNVEGVISYDTYTAHVASLVAKKLTVIAKSEENIDKVSQRFVPFLGKSPAEIQVL